MAEEMKKAPAGPAMEAKKMQPAAKMSGGMPNAKDVEENKVIAAIGYLGILCFVPLLMKKESAFAQFHGKQALAIFIVEVAAAVVNLIPVLGWIISLVLFLVCGVASIMGIINAVGGKQKEIPGFTMIAEKLNI
jgi:uncharacterized membrane protein